MAKTLVQEFSKGLWAEIPPFRLVLGLCPTLAITNTLENAYGMGVAVTFVLTFSNILIAALRKIIPPKVRIVAYIVVIATFVCVVELVMQAYAYALFRKLGIYIPLIVVNCIPMGRAEAFAAQFKGVSVSGPAKLTKDGGSINAISGATITSRAVAGGVSSAFSVYERLKPQIEQKLKELRK